MSRTTVSVNFKDAFNEADHPRDGGKFTSSSHHYATDTKDVMSAVEKAHAEIDKHVSKLNDHVNELELAHGDREELEGELEDGEEYSEPEDQKDYEKRAVNTGNDSAKHAYAARDRLHAIMAAAQKHLDVLNGHLSRIHEENTEKE